ncbi:MAG: Rrf2 family transcriptional regulator, partial [Gammaproteobacteria bacterium]
AAAISAMVAFGVSRNHLMKVVQFLGQQGWLHNVRGRGGGLELACAPERINLGVVVRAAEGAPLPAECFDRAHNTCAIARTCRLRGVLGEAVDAFHAVLDAYTLADITRDMRPLGQVLKVVQRGLRSA